MTEPIEDKKILLDFIQKILISSVINWRINSSACSNWTGVTCDHHRSSIIALPLHALSFHGPIPLNTLNRLSNLQILSLRSNGLSGPFPSNFSNLTNLTSLHLQCNNFSGPLPLNLSVWNNVSILNLSNNGFTGSISPSISSVTHLIVLSLANNSLSGEIPDFCISSLQIINLSNNIFTGTLPRSLKRFPSSTFLGNNIVPDSYSLSLPVLSPQKKHSKLDESAILGIVIGCSILVLGLLALMLVVWHLKTEARNQDLQRTDKNQKDMENLRSRSIGNGNGNLVFFEGGNLVFNSEDPFRAST